MRTEPALQGQTYLKPKSDVETSPEEQTITSYNRFFRFGLETAGYYAGGIMARGIGVMNIPKISYNLGTAIGIMNIPETFYDLSAAITTRFLKIEEETTLNSFHKVTAIATGYFVAGEAQVKLVDPSMTYIGSAIGLKTAGFIADVLYLEGTTPPLKNPLGKISRAAIKAGFEATGGYLGGRIARGAGLVHIPELFFSQTPLGWISAGVAQTYGIDFITNYIGARIGMKLGGIVAEVCLFPIEKIAGCSTSETSIEPSNAIPSNIELSASTPTKAQIRAARIARIYKKSHPN